MSKTDLTKRIESALNTYSPAAFGDFEFNYRRTQYKEYECPVRHSHIEDGLVDMVWLAEGYNNHSIYSYCNAVNRLRVVEHLTRETSCSLTEDEIRSIGSNTFYPCLYDGKCFWKRQRKGKQEAVAVICFEIKISKEDFRSTHGHNFVGNLNFYVMPHELYKSVKDSIPENIGVITYHDSADGSVGRLKKQKDSFYTRDVDSVLYNSLLHTVLNRQSKMLTKIQRASLDAMHSYRSQIEKKFSNISSKLKRVIAAPEDCYNPSKYGCTNCNPIQIRCETCPYGSAMRYEVFGDVREEEVLNEHYRFVLRS